MSDPGGPVESYGSAGLSVGGDYVCVRCGVGQRGWDDHQSEGQRRLPRDWKGLACAFAPLGLTARWIGAGWRIPCAERLCRLPGCLRLRWRGRLPVRCAAAKLLPVDLFARRSTSALMLTIFASFLLATPNGAAQARSAWYDCLDAYAQVAMFSVKTPASVAIAALGGCSDERRAFQQQLFRKPRNADPRSSNDPVGPSFLAEEDRDAARHVIAFVLKNRRTRRPI